MKRKSNPTGESVSKTAKASMGKGKNEGFKASGDMNRIISLNNGEFAYLMHPGSGLTYKLKVGTHSWNNMLLNLLEDVEHGPRIEKELKELGWQIPTRSED
jgi:hypothetical protein